MENVVIAFATTSDAMAMEHFCKKVSHPGNLIPIPNQLSAGCGLAWMTDSNSESQVTNFLKENNLSFELVKLLKFDY